MVDRSQAAAIAEAAQRELSRRALLDFSERCAPGWQRAPHLQLIAERLEAVERGELRRLAVSVHPGSGKSTLLQRFCGWYLGRNPRRRIITTSAGAELAERNSRATRALFSEDAWPFDVRLSTETLAQHRWDTNRGGGLAAFGCEALITGWRADLIVCDDLQNSAGSESERARLWQWFSEILNPRLEPGGAVVVIQTRWSEDDLIGRLGESGEPWEIINLPAISESGAVLWPQRFSVEELERRRVAMGSRAFEAQFMGNPVPLEGNVIKAEWLARYSSSELPERFDAKVLAVDCASKTGISNDYSVIAVVGATKDAFFVLDVIRRKVEYPELVRMLGTAFDAHKPSSVYVEDASSGVVLLQELQRETRLPVVGVRASGSKISRVEGVTGLFEAGRVRLPIEAPWLLDFERELLAFPNAKHDDQVDAVVLALAQLRERTRQKPFAMRGPAPGGW